MEDIICEVWVVGSLRDILLVLLKHLASLVSELVLDHVLHEHHLNLHPLLLSDLAILAELHVNGNFITEED